MYRTSARVSPAASVKSAWKLADFKSSVRWMGDASTAGTPFKSSVSQTGDGRFTKSVIPSLISPKIPARNSPCCVGRESGSKGKYPRTPIRPFPRKKTLSKNSSFQPSASEQISHGSSFRSFRMMTPPYKPSAAHDTGSLRRWQMRCRSYTRRCPRQRSHRRFRCPSA